MRFDGQLIEKLDKLIRSGELESVRKYLGKLKIKNISKKHILDLSKISRRVDWAGFGLKLLDFHLDLDSINVQKNNFDLAIEYANCLNKLSIFNQAEDILIQDFISDNMEAHIALAKVYMKQWNYEPAIPLLRHYCHSVPEKSYEQIVGRLNLGLCYQSIGEFNAAYEEAKWSLKSHFKSLPLVELQSRLILTKYYLSKKNYKSASEEMQKIYKKEYITSPSVTHLLVAKTKAYLKAVSSNKKEPGISELLSVKMTAAQYSHWETVRSCDWLIAKATENERLAKEIYFGTQNIGIRNEIEQLYSDMSKQPYCDFNEKGSNCFNLRDLKNYDLSPKIFSLLQIMCFDRYTLFRLPYLFSILYPNSKYDLEGSNDRTYQIIKRARTSIKKLGIPFRIVNESKGFRLVFEENVKFRIFREQPFLIQKSDRYLHELNKINASFSAIEAQKILGLSQSQVSRILKDAVELNFLIREKQGRKIRYKKVA